MKAKANISNIQKQNRLLKKRNLELEETLRAIQAGEVDAVVIAGPAGNRIFTLQSAEQPYRELVEAMNEGALTVSPQGIILYCNAKFEAMTRVPHSKLVGSDFREHICPDHLVAVQDLLVRSKSNPSSIEVSLKIGNQISLPVQLSISAIELVGTDGFCIIATDLSAQKQNAILFREQEWLGSLLSLLPVPLVLLDADLQGFTFINAKATEILEGTVVRGKNQTSIPMPLAFEDEQGYQLEIRDLLIKLDSVNRTKGIETTLKTRSKKIPVLLFSEMLPAMHGRDPARLLMFQDISSIKEAQLDLSLALKDRDQFMAALSHELRTPINVILGWVQLLRAHPTDTVMVSQALDTLDRNSELQRDLIENLLDMSRIITGSLLLQTKSLDLKSSVRDCIISLQPKITEKALKLTVDQDADPTFVVADEQRMQQLISNLIQNAIKFTPSGGKITVTVHNDKRAKMASVTVQDNGQGIDPVFLPHVFDQFKQENMSTNRTHGGLGLGLAICKKIVEQHNGSLSATSNGLNRGSVFSFRLPLSACVEIAIEKSELKPIETKLNGIKVLLVDDSADNLALFSIWLKKSGAEIKTLNSALGVVEAINSFKPDVLLSDISMPGEDGYALIAKVRALSRQHGGMIPAGALTANARPEDRALTEAAGYQMHIAKPVNSNGLLEAVRVLAEMSQLIPL